MRLPRPSDLRSSGKTLLRIARRFATWPALGLATGAFFLLFAAAPAVHPGLSQIVRGINPFTTAPAAGPSRAPSPLRERATHPSTHLSPYFSLTAPTDSASVLSHFHALLQQYIQRQSRDDNFTIRVLDRRSNTVLERFELADLRAKHRRGRPLRWETVDARRYKAMDRLVDKYESAGVPLEDIIVRWGRANQVDRAHERDRPYQVYERRLAESLGLSLLATEIGTVETFNQDHLVSAAGARSRYQMLPWVLRRSGVTRYTLMAQPGTRVDVRETHHPLLVLEPAFLLLRGYVNAVGHELPGLSAYHTGPGNIFKLYRHYYATGPLSRTSTVADAFAWALTKGFDVVSDESSFGGDSRGYVPALYGALVARHDRPIDRSPALQAVRLQLRAGASVRLRTLLAPLRARTQPLDWGPAADTATTAYDRFRALNPHFDLPPSPTGAVPPAGNVRIVSAVEGESVEFFLPLRAPALLRKAGVEALRGAETFRFDNSTFTAPTPRRRTQWDRRYDALVDDIAHFGFTDAHRAHLLRLFDRFEALAAERPTRFRRHQLRIIRIHKRLWQSGPWETLAATTQRAMRGRKVAGQPLDALPTSPPLPDSLPTAAGAR